ncbi:MAG: hypothetical protein M3Q55_13045 [Acidobacteriota bacterium]|nr:hypothetical protein [Acidobacteriota bacterium]
MKQVLLGVFLLSTAMPVGFVATQTARAADVVGTWSARVYEKDKAGAPVEARLQLQMNVDDDRERNLSNWGQSVRVSELVNLPANLDAEQDVKFELRRDAGVVAFDGHFERGRGVGHLAFTANREFARALAQQSNDTPSDRELFSYALVDVSRAFVSELRAMGFGDVSLDEAYKLRIHGTTIDFIKSIRAEYPNVDLDDIRKLRIHGVHTTYIAGLKSAGLQNPSLDEVLKFRIHGVTLDYVKEMRALGLAHDLDDIVQSRIHGVTPAFAKEMAELGYRNLDFSDLRTFRIHGVSPAFVRDMSALGYTNVDADTLVKFRIHGITPKFVKELKDAGYTNLSEDELVDWAIHGRRLMKSRRR